MRASELIEKAQLVIDSKGKKSAVQLDYATWEELLALLEDLEDLEEIGGTRRSGEEYVPSEQVQEELSARGDARIAEAINRVCAEVDTSLDPAISAMQRTWLSKEDW